MPSRITHLFLATWVVFMVLSSGAWACEGCANFDAISTGQSVKMVQAGFSWSVLFMLSMPLLLMFWLFRIMVKACEQADERTAQRAQNDSPAG